MREHRNIADAIVILVLAIIATAAVVLLWQHERCPGPITGPQAMPWVNAMRSACTWQNGD